MTLNEFYDAVAREADTPKKPIDAGTVRHVLTVAFRQLSRAMVTDALTLLGKGLASAAKVKPIPKK